MEVYRVSPDLPCQTRSMLRLLWFLFVLAARSVRFRRDLLLENLALRQQLAALKRRHPQPRFRVADKLFWVMLRRLWPGWKRALVLVQPETLRRLWPGWKRALVLVQPETVVRWHSAGFKLYWEWISRHCATAGRRCVSRELRELIRSEEHT